MMKTVLPLLLTAVAFISASADTQDYIKCSVIYKTPNIIYFDAGSSDGVVAGEEFEVYYDERIVATGKIDWSDKNISRSSAMDPGEFADIYYYDDLSAKIHLYVALANKGGFLTLPYFSDLELEPYGLDTPDERMVGRLIHRGLLTRNQSGSIIGDLARMYEVRGLTYTFYLDPDAVFHSGKPVEATDVAYSLERLAKASKLTAASSFVLAIRGAREFRHGAINEIPGVFLIDRKTVSITLNNPFPAFEEYLAGPGGYIIPKPGITDTGGYVNGAGPYKITHRELNSLTLVPANAGGGDVFLDSLIFMRFKNSEEAALSMELGRLDIIPVLGEPPPKFISTSSYASLTGKTFCSAILGFNGQREYQKESLFSRAMSFLIDRESIVRVILGGSAALPEGPIAGLDPGAVDYSYILIPDSVDFYLSKIKKLPANVTLYVDSRYPVLSKVSRYVAGQLGGKGIKVSEKTVDFSYLDETRVKSELDMYLSYYDPVCDDPDCILYPLFSSKLSGHSNYLFYEDSPFQSFLENLRAETDPERRRMLTYGLAQSVANEPPALILFEPYLVVIAKPDIAGIKMVEEGYIDLRGVYIEND